MHSTKEFNTNIKKFLGLANRSEVMLALYWHLIDLEVELPDLIFTQILLLTLTDMAFVWCLFMCSVLIKEAKPDGLVTDSSAGN